jgi:cyclohexanone monooxygenase
LKQHWKDAPTSYMGIATSGFPNMFMILGPNSPFTNLVPAIESQVEWIGEAIKLIEGSDTQWIDVKPEQEAKWTETCTEIANATLFPKADSWIFGHNIPGKKPSVLFYLGGLKNYRAVVREELKLGFPNFTTDARVPVGV